MTKAEKGLQTPAPLVARVIAGFHYNISRPILLFWLFMLLYYIHFASGKYGIICMEDLIHEIYTVGPRFKEASNFLWPFKLSAPRKGFKKVTNHFVEGGDFGNREDRINELVRRMN